MMMRKGGRLALTDEQVRLIKENLVLGMTCSALARHFDVGEETIGRIRRGLTYRHVEVKGEEALRPELIVVPKTKGQAQMLTGMTEEEEGKAAAESLAQLQTMIGLAPAALNAEIATAAATAE